VKQLSSLIGDSMATRLVRAGFDDIHVKECWCDFF
jgi:hypothetical protein